MFDRLPAQVAGFQVQLGIERMDDPHLVTPAAGGNVEALFEELLIAQPQRAAFRGIDQGDEDHVALVTLELRRAAAKQAMHLIAVGREILAQQTIDRDRLIVADQRNYPETNRPSVFVDLILRL